MRPDVKLGVAISAVLVLVSGLYFLYRDKGESPVPVAAGPEAATDRVAAGTPSGGAPPQAARPTARPGQRQVADSESSPATPRGGGTPVRRISPARSPGAGMPSRPELGERVADSTSNDRAGAAPHVPPTSAAQPQRQVPVDQPPAAESGSGGPGGPDTPVKAADSPAPERVAAGTQAGQAVPLTGRMPSTAPDSPTGSPTAAVDIHRVQPGDTVSSLSRAYYGSEKYTQFLIDSNPGIGNPDHLAVGATVRIPPRPDERTLQPGGASAVEKPASPQVPGTRRTYTVKPGDSFYAIARDVLNDASRWKELFELNKALVNGEPTRLRPGQIVVLPDP